MLQDDIKVCLFKNYHSTIPIEVNLWEWLKDDSRKADIEYLRTLNDKDDIRIIKSSLPCITPSGTFSERKLSGLIKHSGIICIDIDADHNPHITDFEQQRNELCNLINVAYCSLSASGRGVFCLIPIQYPEKHKLHFEALKLNFESQGITIDKSCGDVTRLRGYSYDPKAYFNESAMVYSQLFDNKIKTSSTTFKPKKNYKFKELSNTQHKVANILAKIQETCIDITGDYGQWSQIGCALANEFQEDGREMFHLVSRYHMEYDANKTNNMFNSCLKGSYRYTLGAFFHWAEHYNLK
jgi:hypothetical protein